MSRLVYDQRNIFNTKLLTFMYRVIKVTELVWLSLIQFPFLTHQRYAYRNIHASNILALWPVPMQTTGPNMKAGIQYSYSLPTHYDYCPTFNALCRLCVQQEKKHYRRLWHHRTTVGYVILFTAQRKRAGHVTMVV